MIQDRFTLRYGLWALAGMVLVAYATELDRLLNLYLLLLPVVAFPLLAIAVGLIVALIHNVIRRRWRRAASVIAGPAIAAALFLALGRAGISPPLLRLLAFRGDYLADVAMAPAPRLLLWDWGSTGGAGVPNVFWTLVYDETDTLSHPPDAWDPAWTRRMSLLATKNDSDSGEALHHAEFDHLQGHFYLMTEVY